MFYIELIDKINRIIESSGNFVTFHLFRGENQNYDNISSKMYRYHESFDYNSILEDENFERYL